MPEFVLRMNGRVSFRFPPAGEEPLSFLEGAFGRMDGEKLFSYGLWGLPDGVKFDDGSPFNKSSDTYVQCAGSKDGLIVEMRRASDVGFDQMSVGRRGGPSDGERAISWQGGVQVVPLNEVWLPKEAAGIFAAYQGGSIDETYLSLRPISI